MKLLNHIIKIIFLLLFLFQGMVQGQISQGGIPIQIQKLKSILSDDLIVLPKVDNEKLRRANSVQQGQSKLKSFHFAHPFDTALTLKNSGKWYSDGEINVWQLRIKSEGAYSLNVIFGRFHLPDNARLFLIGEKSSDIKGAYTSENNSESQVLAVEPLAGEEILIQYEEPVGVTFAGELEITRISHDFIGIKAADPRIPLGVSGPCNVNVNCNVAEGTEEIRDAVCRILVEGTELCTGTLINNTLQDGTPYLLTAYHCINTQKAANSTVFVFNFESPTCTTVIGDVSRSMSGSSLTASFDSLDFALVRLNSRVPLTYRPYFAGWNRINQPPSSSMTIHHPLGDIKKVAIDNNPAITSRYNISYLLNGNWKILRWDQGVTEIGSSGGALLDQNKQIIGTLTGGSANCGLPVDDYFGKFALAWDYRKETNKQLKVWLDPAQSNVQKLNGKYDSPVVEACKPYTNFMDKELYSAIQILDGTTKRGYFSGTNTAGFTEFAEQYKFSKSCDIQGVTLGIAKAKTTFSQAFINVRVYEGANVPNSTPLYSQKFDIKRMLADGMNYLEFQTPVHTTGNFFISYNIQELHPGDTLAVYMANRKDDNTNSFLLKKNAGWVSFNSQNTLGNGSALLTELIACSVDPAAGIDTIDVELEAHFFPNPINGNATLTVRTKNTIDFSKNIAVYDLLGKAQNVSFIQIASNELLLNFNRQRRGIYFVQIVAGGRTIVGKVAFIP